MIAHREYQPYERGTGRPLTADEVQALWGLPDHEVLKRCVFLPPRWAPKLDANGRWPAAAPIRIR